jgi:hypothetical protein
MRASVGLLAAGLATAGTTSCVDASHDLQVQALGSEVPGVAPGPLHRPGQPCLVCHGAEGPSSHLLVVAGTVYGTQRGSPPSLGARVIVEDVDGTSFSATTNSAGNFYISDHDWSPTFPLLVEVAHGADTRPMVTYIARDGSCSSCHGALPTPSSPGPVYVSDGSSTDGGA